MFTFEPLAVSSAGAFLLAARLFLSDETVPIEVRDFLIEHIDSVAQLEALLLLRGLPQQDWDMPTIARRLHVQEPEAKVFLSGLVACELVSTDGSVFRYRTRDRDQRLMDRVARSHARHLVLVTRLIHDKTSKRRLSATGPD